MSLTHFNEKGDPRMVGVGEKEDTKRVALAQGRIIMESETLKAISGGGIEKGDVLSVATVAGILGGKKTSDLIPMCHPLFLTGLDLEYQLEENGVLVKAVARTVGKTGVEMEALTAVSIACLTIYDMCKAMDRRMTITDICLLEKEGGKSGHFRRTPRGVVLDINISPKKGTVKTPVPSAELVVEHGILGDAHAGKWHRQVSLLAKHSIDKMRAQGLELQDGDFAENITTDGIDLHHLPVGTKLTVGKEVLLEVSQIGKECHKGCQIKQKVGECIMPTEGIFAIVLRGGVVHPGDTIEVCEP